MFFPLPFAKIRPARPLALWAVVLSLALNSCSVLPEPEAPKHPTARKAETDDILLEEVVVIGDRPETPPPMGGGGGFSGGGGGGGGDGGGGGGGGGGDGGGGDSDYANVSGTNFRMSIHDQVTYPRFTAMVKNLGNFVNSSAEVTAALTQYTRLTPTQITEQLKFGNGPIIKIGPTPGNSYGYFDKNNPNVLTLSQTFVAGLESAKLPTTIQATSFLLATTTLHEYVHYGNFSMSFNPPPGVEMGDLFERAGFTVNVNKNNAYETYINFFSN